MSKLSYNAVQLYLDGIFSIVKGYIICVEPNHDID